jgi:hypothetical protein
MARGSSRKPAEVVVEAAAPKVDGDLHDLNRTLEALADPSLPDFVRPQLRALRAEVASLKALRALTAGVEAANLKNVTSGGLENLPESVRTPLKGLKGLHDLGDALNRPWRRPPNEAELTLSLTNVQKATGNTRLTNSLRDALCDKAVREGHKGVARRLRDLEVEAVPVASGGLNARSVSPLLPEPPGGARAGQFESVLEGLPKLTKSVNQASRQLHKSLKAELDWHSRFHLSLARSHAHLARHLNLLNRTEDDRKKERKKEQKSLAAVRNALARRLTPAERIIAADMIRRGKTAEAVVADLRRIGVR